MKKSADTAGDGASANTLDTYSTTAAETLKGERQKISIKVSAEERERERDEKKSHLKPMGDVAIELGDETHASDKMAKGFVSVVDAFFGIFGWGEGVKEPPAPAKMKGNAVEDNAAKPAEQKAESVVERTPPPPPVAHTPPPIEHRPHISDEQRAIDESRARRNLEYENEIVK